MTSVGTNRGPTRHWRVGMVGFGAVGRALARLLADRAAELRERHGVTCSIGLLATRRHGTFIAGDGAPPGGGIVVPAAGQNDWLRELEAGVGSGMRGVAGGGVPAPGAPRSDVPRHVADLLVALPDAPVDVLVEMTPLDRLAGEPATSHLRAAIAHGIHAVTANKGPIALHGPELRAEAAAARLALRFEATLMDCLPAQVLRETIVPVGTIDSFAGIVNSTTNFVLDAMALGQDPADAVAEAQRLGIAEADPSADLDGWDAAFKAAILGQALLGLDVRVGEVRRQGIRSLDPREPARAVAHGERLRLVARGSRERGEVQVAPERVPAATLLGSTSGFSMALAIETSHAGKLEVALIEPHVPQTAYAILMDLLAIDRAARAGEVVPPRGWAGRTQT